MKSSFILSFIYLTILLIKRIKPSSLNSQKSSLLNYHEKNAWLDNLLTQQKLTNSAGLERQRHRRNLYQLDDVISRVRSQQQNQQNRPCPHNCNCNYETINCNGLISTCNECLYWPKIDFNQIYKLTESAFKHFKFAPGKITNVIIYKLLNSTIGAGTFNDFIVPPNSHIEVTFQYNSLIKFDHNVLKGLKLGHNSTLIFNFPYTTQVCLLICFKRKNEVEVEFNFFVIILFDQKKKVVFASHCFDGIEMASNDVRFIVRIIKSFSVIFSADLSNFIDISDQISIPTSFNLNSNDNDNNNKNTSSSSSKSNKSNNKSSSTSHFVNNAWQITTGQIIIDIKSTHLVKFEENSLSNIELDSKAHFVIDLGLIEKLWIQKNAFGGIIQRPFTSFILYAKQISFIDFRAYSFTNWTLQDNANAQIYFEELTPSICFQRNLFHNLKIHHSQFNISFINSKNIMLMHDVFSHLSIVDSKGHLTIGVYTKPSFSLFVNDNYQNFLKYRRQYLSSSSSSSRQSINGLYSDGSVNLDQAFIRNDLFPGNSSSSSFFNNGNNYYSFNHNLNKNRLNVYDKSSDIIDIFYADNKQTYRYNFSIEKNCFSNLTTTTANGVKNLKIIADNIDTLLIDDFIVNYSNNQQQKKQQQFNNNIYFLVNVKHLALSQETLKNVYKTWIEFLRTPLNFKLGLASQQHHQKQQRIIKLSGFNRNLLEISKLSIPSVFNKNSFQNNKKEMSIDNSCQISMIPNDDTIINLDPSGFKFTPLKCTCQMVELVYNQLDTNRLENVLPCTVPNSDFIASCRQQLESKCQFFLNRQQQGARLGFYNEDDNLELNKRNGNIENFLDNYVKLWTFCISEPDPELIKQNDRETSLSVAHSYYYNHRFSDIDRFFSLSSSPYNASFDMSQSSYIDDTGNGLSGDPTQNDTTNKLASNIGKVVGIVILCFVCSIVFFMIAINCIQYKFRNDLLDDYDFVSPTSNGIITSRLNSNTSRSGSGGGGGGGHIDKNKDIDSNLTGDDQRLGPLSNYNNRKSIHDNSSRDDDENDDPDDNDDDEDKMYNGPSVQNNFKRLTPAQVEKIKHEYDEEEVEEDDQIDVYEDDYNDSCEGEEEEEEEVEEEEDIIDINDKNINHNGNGTSTASSTSSASNDSGKSSNISYISNSNGTLRSPIITSSSSSSSSSSKSPKNKTISFNKNYPINNKSKITSNIDSKTRKLKV
jgi:hypothetical protein